MDSRPSQRRVSRKRENRLFGSLCAGLWMALTSKPGLNSREELCFARLELGKLFLELAPGSRVKAESWRPVEGFPPARGVKFALSGHAVVTLLQKEKKWLWHPEVDSVTCTAGDTLVIPTPRKGMQKDRQWIWIQSGLHMRPCQKKKKGRKEII